MCDHTTGHICQECAPTEICKRLNVLIAQTQRMLDLEERLAGYDAMPRGIIVTAASAPALAQGIDFFLPAFEKSCNIQWLSLTSDATNTIDINIKHPSIIAAGNKYQILRFRGNNTFNPGPLKITMPAGSQLGFNAAALGAATFVAFSVGWTMSEETSIEYFKSLRAGRQ